MSAPVRTPKFSIREAIRFGWLAARRYFWFFVTMLIATSIVDGIPRKIQLATRENAPLISALAGLLGAAVAMVTTIGWTKVLLRIVDGERPSHSDLYAHHALLFNFLGVGLLFMIPLAAAAILLPLIPGVLAVVHFGVLLVVILAAVRYSMSAFLVVDRGMGPLEAMRRSAEITGGEPWHLFVSGLALMGLTLLGAFALLIGLLWTFPAAMVAWAFIYRRLSPRQPEVAAATPAAAVGDSKGWWAPSR